MALPNINNIDDLIAAINTYFTTPKLPPVTGAQANYILQNMVSLLVASDNNLQTEINGKQNALGFNPENTANKNVVSGYAGLDSSGKVPSSLLPSYVDDVIEAANFAALPSPGESGKIYVTLDTNFEYRWGGSVYVRIVASPGTTDQLTEGVSNLYYTNARVKAYGDLNYLSLSASQNLVPYTGANGNVNLASYTLSANFVNAVGGGLQVGSDISHLASITSDGANIYLTGSGGQNAYLNVPIIQSGNVNGTQFISGPTSHTDYHKAVIIGSAIGHYGQPSDFTWGGPGFNFTTQAVIDPSQFAFAPYDGTSGGSYYYYLPGDMVFMPGQTEKIRFKSNGAIFVGYTIDPTSGNAFAVNGASFFGGRINMPASIDIAFGTVGSSFIGEYFNSSANSLYFYNGVGGAPILSLNQTDNSVSVANGNLHVNGSITQSSVASSLLKADASGVLIPAVKGTDYIAVAASADLSAQTSVGTVLVYTTTATAVFDLHVYLNVTAISTNNIAITVTYTDENSNSRTINYGYLTSVQNSSYQVVTIKAKTGTAITISTTNSITGGTNTFDAGARITQL